ALPSSLSAGGSRISTQRLGKGLVGAPRAAAAPLSCDEQRNAATQRRAGRVAAFCQRCGRNPGSTAMKELMVQVERAVRPVQASARRKDRMREELLAHLTCIYEAELQRCGDEHLARETALQRLGNLRELTCGLQESVSLPERVEWRLERWL